MKKYTSILVFLLSISSILGQTEYAIETNPGTPSSNYTLKANTNFSIHINVFIDANSTLKGFKTTFDGTHELEWDLTKFEKNKWIEIAHSFTTTSAMENPVLKFDMIDAPNTGFGTGSFYTDHIRIYDTSSLSLEDLNTKIKIYPNPVTNILTIKNIKAESEVFVYNILGSKIKPKLNKLDYDSFMLNMSNFPSGMYFLKIHQEGKVFIKKIAKKD